MSELTELLTKAVKAEYNTTKNGQKATIDTAIVWGRILHTETEETLVNLIAPAVKADSERMAMSVRHCPSVETMYSDAATVEDVNARRKAKNAAQRYYAIVWRGLVRGASLVVLDRHNINVDVRVKGEALPFIRLVNTLDGVTHERDVSITGVVSLAKALLEGGTGINAKPEKSVKADTVYENSSEVSIDDLVAICASKLAGRNIEEFAKTTVEHIEALRETLERLYVRLAA